jgi:hypothetical protein
VRLLISILPPPADNAPADNELKDCRANADQFFFVFGDGFMVVAQTCISEAEVIMAERNVRVQSQRGLELPYNNSS